MEALQTQAQIVTQPIVLVVPDTVKKMRQGCRITKHVYSREGLALAPLTGGRISQELQTDWHLTQQHSNIRRLISSVFVMALALTATVQMAFDHTHTVFTAIVQSHVENLVHSLVSRWCRRSNRCHWDRPTSTAPP